MGEVIGLISCFTPPKPPPGQVASDIDMLISASTDHTVRLWDYNKPDEPLVHVRGPIVLRALPASSPAR